jgi:ribosomal protein S6
MQYELLYLVAASKEAGIEATKAAVTGIVTEEGGVFEPKQTQEKRKLSYEIKHETHGIYIAQRFNLDAPEKIQAITRKLNLHTEVLRSIIARADELPELLTKEERIEAANRPVRREQPVEVKKPETKVQPEVKPEPIEVAPTEKEEKANEEDLDKKLEEILNI